MQKVLYVRSGSRYRVAKGVEIQEAASYVEARRFEAGRPLLDGPDAAKKFLLGQLQHSLSEFFCVIYLDARMRVIAFEKMFRGTVDGAVVHIREVVREVIDRNAVNVILAHNHPSGEADPSAADIQLTKSFLAALALFEVRVLDHFVVGGSRVASLQEMGLM
jgi:DNA repair protein RadC